MTGFELPSVFPQSSGSSFVSVAHPEDLGLDVFVEQNLALSRELQGTDFLGGGYGDGLNYAQRHALGLLTAFEQDPEIIRRRQAVVRELLANAPLRTFLLTRTLTPKDALHHSTSWDALFAMAVKVGQEFLAYVHDLHALLPDSDASSDLKKLKGALQVSQESGDVKSLSDLVNEVTGPTKTQVQFHLYEPQSSSWMNPRHYYYISVETVLGRKMQENGRMDDNYDLCRPHVHGESVIYRIVAEQVAKQGDESLNGESRREIRINVVLDEIAKTAHGTVTYEAFSWSRLWKNILSGKFMDSCMVGRTKDVSFAFDEMTHRCRDTIRYAVGRLGNTLYNDVMDGQRIIKNLVVELRTLALLAEFYVGAQKQGIPVTFPMVFAKEEARTHVEDLVELNLLKNTPVENIVPNTVDLSSQRSLCVLTGPVRNGKSTYCMATGQVYATTQAGLPALAKRAEVSVKDCVISHCPRPGDVRMGTSKHSRDLQNLVNLAQQVTPYSLVILDDFCTGAEPEAGKHRLEEGVRAVSKTGATMLVPTHFHNLIQLAQELPFGVNLRALAEPDGNGRIAYLFKVGDGWSTFTGEVELATQMGADYGALMSTLEARVERKELTLRT